MRGAGLASPSHASSDDRVAYRLVVHDGPAADIGIVEDDLSPLARCQVERVGRAQQELIAGCGDDCQVEVRAGLRDRVSTSQALATLAHTSIHAVDVLGAASLAGHDERLRLDHIAELVETVDLVFVECDAQIDLHHGRVDARALRIGGDVHTRASLALYQAKSAQYHQGLADLAAGDAESLGQHPLGWQPFARLVGALAQEADQAPNQRRAGVRLRVRLRDDRQLDLQVW